MNDTNYFDHDADIGIIGRGETLEACYIDAAKAMFALMTDLNKVSTLTSIVIEFEEEDIELAFVTWLNTLLAKAQADNLIFSEFEIIRQNNSWHGKASGETWRPEMERGIEVKGATLTMLSVKQVNQHWEGKCVVDV